mgnify:FL=1
MALILVFRLFYPKSRTIPINEGVILLLSATASLLINSGLIASYLSDIIEPLKSLQPLTDDEFKLLRSLLVYDNSGYTFRPFAAGISHVFPIIPASATNLWAFLLDLHLRAFLVGATLFGFFKIPGKLEQQAQCLPYKKGFPVTLSKWEMVIAILFGVKLESPNKYEKHQERIKSGILSWFRDALYHPWARLTSHNRNREILIVDVLTKEGSIYSGWLTGWIPSVDSMLAIPMEFALRFHPTTKEGEERRLSFIKNNGELIIPMNEVVTLHFWEIRKNFETTIVIRKKRDIERLKWILVLAHVFPGFFSNISIHIFLTNEEHLKFAQELDVWLQDSEIHIDDEIVEIIVDDERQEKEAKNHSGKPPINDVT